MRIDRRDKYWCVQDNENSLISQLFLIDFENKREYLNNITTQFQISQNTKVCNQKPEISTSSKHILDKIDTKINPSHKPETPEHFWVAIVL